MSKVTGSYESLIKGVSEQVAHQRYPGQNWEQVNMVSDPVRGLARRRGSVMMSEQHRPEIAFDTPSREDGKSFGEQSLYLGVNEYSIMHRKRAVAGSTMPILVVLNKTTGNLLPVVAHGNLAGYAPNGFNSITAVGNLVLLAPKGVASRYTAVDQVTNSPAANSVAAWVKGGSYSRTYTLSVKRASDQQVITVQYTTPTSYYPGMLDTSDIPAVIPDPEKPGQTKPNPDYQKLVNDRVYAYQKDVNQWIGTAAAAIQPAAIAAKLQALISPSFPGSSGLIGSTIIIDGGQSVSCDDGGSGEQFIGVARTVKAAADLTTVHRTGKVVKIKPTSGKSYYVKAIAKDGTTDGWTQVIWEECPGVLITPTAVTAIGAVHNGTFYVAPSPAELAALAGINVPPWEPSSSGDLDSQSLPAFLDREINYIRMFQDRLIIIAGATVFMSRSGDYFNFFRTSALNIQDNDPIEVYALGSEDDVITAGTLLDRNLILFGKQWQYAVPGRDAITPQNAFVAVQSGYRDSNTCPPESSGNLIFFGQKREGKLTIQQMQTGAYADTLDAFEITQQLNKYLIGDPVQIEAVTSPSALFVRTTADANGVWVYSYLDSQNNAERLFDSWSKWTFSKTLGDMIGMTTKDGDLYVTTLRHHVNGSWFVTDRFTMNTDVPDCHLDSQRRYIAAGSMTIGNNDYPELLSGAYNSTASRYWLQGDTFGERLEALREQIGPTYDPNLLIGADFESYVVLTNPYIRDKDGKAILDGRLTLGNMNVTVFESSAMDVSICDLVNADSKAYAETLRWVARNANDWVLNTQQVADTASVVVGVYKEVRDCKVKLAGRSWLPLTLSAIEWQGQFYTRRRQ
ncbi:tail tuber protein B [Pseudomonas phage Bf7]|uniref:Tail tuber protein B n=1 Tax=Pseudomonas phage Bf7 TaxID=1100790 RepID=H2ELX4_9CAUD|nr:tail protein [Pseudomonas phage Bf7]AEX65876.1 tail tuber protein B [Pseudomonas phage Bf7]